jgi:UTP--glucose-1-phosphate uridylyltransferase
MAPLVKLGNHYKKVSDFQKRIPSIPRILELDHLTITGNVNLGKNITLRGTVIIVASNNDTIDIPPGSVLENVTSLQFLRLLFRSLSLAPCPYWSTEWTAGMPPVP